MGPLGGGDIAPLSLVLMMRLRLRLRLMRLLPGVSAAGVGGSVGGVVGWGVGEMVWIIG